MFEASGIDRMANAPSQLQQTWTHRREAR